MMSVQAMLALFLGFNVLGLILALVVPERKSPNALAWTASLAAGAVLAASGHVLLFGDSWQTGLWTLPSLGKMVLVMDRLSALFVFVTGLVFLPVSIFSSRYMRNYFGRYNIEGLLRFLPPALCVYGSRPALRGRPFFPLLVGGDDCFLLSPL